MHLHSLTFPCSAVVDGVSGAIRVVKCWDVALRLNVCTLAIVNLDTLFAFETKWGMTIGAIFHQPFFKNHWAHWSMPITQSLSTTDQ